MSTNVYRNALPAGAMLLEYRLESVLGAGGFGMTYLARDVNLDKPVAIKEYFPTDLAVRTPDGGVVSTQTDGESSYKWGLDRFLQEARTLAKFSHPHIVRVNRYFEAHDTGYMVMDYEDGESLHQFLRREPAPGEARLKQILIPLLDGLQAVHGAGFLHRDIKPANIFLRRNGAPVLIDFGSARQAVSGNTRTLTSVLTPGYAPLEQYSGDGNQGPWTDIYAMGGVLFRALVGDGPPDAVSRLKNDAVPRTLTTLRGRVSQPTIGAIEWAMALDEKIRPQSVDDWRKALDGKTAAPVAARSANAEASTRLMTPGLAPAQTGMTSSPVSARVSTPVSAPASQRIMTRRPATEENTSGWRWVGAGLALLLVLGGGYEWNKRSKAKELAAQEEARAAQARQAEEKRLAEQQLLDQRMALLREKEKITADREAALRQLEQDRARERERERERERAVPPASVALAPPPFGHTPVPISIPAPPPAEGRPAPHMPFGDDPMAAKKEADFRRADVNGDGVLTREEAAHMHMVPEQFHHIDTNGDGRITLAEFLAWKPFPKPPGGPPKR